MADAGVFKRKAAGKEPEKYDSLDENNGKIGQQTEAKPDNQKPKLKFGPPIVAPFQRLWVRIVLVVSILFIIWYTDAPSEMVLATQKEFHEKRGHFLECDRDFLEEIKAYPDCKPKSCGRFVMDTIVTANEADILLNMAKKGIALGGGQRSASILDLHSGALSYGGKFVNIYKLKNINETITKLDLAIYKKVREKIHESVAKAFEIDKNKIHLTYPTFFSKLTNAEAHNIHDEYWHEHVDKGDLLRPKFQFTIVLYLGDYGYDFEGGQLVFLTTRTLNIRNVTLDPRIARVVMYTSGLENMHFVRPITSGDRHALVFSYTCNKSASVAPI